MAMHVLMEPSHLKPTMKDSGILRLIRKKVLTAENEKALEKKLADYKATLSEEDLQELVERTDETLKQLTEEEFSGLVFLPAEDME